MSDIRGSISRVLFIAVALGLATTPIAFAAQNITNHGVVWAVSYDGDFLPNNVSSDPAWSALVVGTSASATVGGGILTLTNAGICGACYTYAEMNNLSYWDGASGGTRENTIEFRMRSWDGSANGDRTGQLSWGDGQYRWYFRFDDNRVLLQSLANQYAIDATSYHTYRVVSSNGLADLYIDNIGNQATPVLSGVPGLAHPVNSIFLGHDSTAYIGQTDWDFVRWTNAGAFTVPEPSVLGLTAMAGLFTTFVIRRRS